MSPKPNNLTSLGHRVWSSLFDWSRRHPQPLQRRELQLSELEDRILFSAAPMAPVAPGPELMAVPAQTADLNPQADIPAADSMLTVLSAAIQHQSVDESSQESSLSVDQDSAVAIATSMRLELVFLDSHVADPDSIRADLQRDTPGRQLVLIELDSSRNGLEQISETLEKYHDVSAIHVVSHGDESTVQLGNTWLSLSNLGVQTPELTAWGNSLAPDADILFYGCDLAASDSGQLLLEAVGILTGADVSASTDATGAAILGGDWDLEYQSGAIETADLFSAQFEQSWDHLLQTAVFQNGLNSYSGTLDLALDPSNPNTVNGGNPFTTMKIGGSDGKQGLLRFDGLFGSGSIPAGSSIENATLSLDVVSPIPVASTISLYRITTNWDANSTWNSLDGGLQVGTETRPVADLTFTVTSSTPGTITLSSAELRNTVQDWSNGQANWGWLIVSNSSQMLELRTSEDGQSSGRPQLAIEYSAVSALMPTGELRVNPLTSGVETTSVRDRGSHDAIATAANGDYVVVYTTPNTFSGYTEDSSSKGVFAQRYNSLGIAQGAMIQVNQFTTGDQAWASVAMAPDGSFAVTWTSVGQDGSQEGVYLRLFNADGTAKANEVRVNSLTTLSQSNSAIAMDDAGNIVVAWQGYGLSDADGIYFRRFNSSGNALDASDRLANTTALNTQYDPSVALSANGTFVIAWDDGVGVHARRFRFSDGIALDTNQVTIQTETTAGNGDVAIDANGNAVVVWRTTGSGDGSGTTIWGRRYSATTNTWQSQFSISQTVANNQTSPSIDMDASGNYIVVWEGKGPGDDAGVFARKFSSTDQPLSPEFLVNLTVTGSQGLASVAVRNLNNFVVAWSGQGPGDDTGVFVRQFGTSAPPSPSLIMSTANNVSGATVPGLTSWSKGDIVRFGEPDYTLGDGTTSGEFQWYGTANNAFQSVVDIDALHFVSEDIVVGSGNASYQLRTGDILFSIKAANTLTDGRTVNATDIMVFRPVTAGNYTLGTIDYLFRGLEFLTDTDLSGLNNITAFTLVEHDTVVGQTHLNAGDFLFARDGSALDNNIYWFHTQGSGSSTAGTADVLLDGDDLGITKKVFGLELIEATTTVGGVTLSTGTLILTPDAAMNNVAGIASIDAQDLFTLNLTATTLDSGTAAGTGAILFDGSFVGLQPGQAPNAFSLVSLNSAPVGVNDTYDVPASDTYTSQESWFDDSWQVRQLITINNSSRNENLIDFPVLVTLDSSRINYSRTHGNGDDLRFVDRNGQELAYEIESWNPSGRSYVWVKIPQIDANSGTDAIWMYYDNATASAGQNPDAVWTNGYVGVWHLSDALSGNSTITDSTANGQDGVATNLDGTDRISGVAGSALEFNGTSEYIRIASSVNAALAINGTELTLEAWAQRNADSTDWMTLIGRQLGTGASDSYSLAQVGGSSANTNFAAAGNASQANALPLNEWRYLSGVRTGTTASLYNNGVLTAQATGLTGPISSDANDLLIGGQENGADNTINQLFTGYLDEIRISNVARSASWTDAQYASMTGSLLDYGSVQTYAGVLENDHDANVDSLSVVSIDTTGTVGTVTMLSNGTFSYDPGANFTSLGAGQTAQTSFTYRVEDGHGGLDTATVTLVIHGSNEAPLLSYANPLTFDVNENDQNPAGHTVADLLASGSGSITDSDTGALTGIAVVGADSANGTWQFSLDGTTWQNLTGTSDTSATLLSLSSQLRFVPSMNYAGPSGDLTFRAWDQTQGNVGDQGVNLGVWSSTAAFSQQSATMSANVVNINNSPIGTTDNYSVTEDTPFSSYSGWLDRGWSYRMAFTFDNSARSEALVDFPVLIELNSANFDYSRVQPQGQDLRFVDTNGALLNYEIESWNPAGSSYVWVRVPQIDANSAIDFIWMYYGNASASAGQNPAGVWSSTYDAVYHFGNAVTASGTVMDSTNQVNGTNVGSTSVTGFLGGGQSFDGVNDRVFLGHNISLLDGAASATISGWVQTGNLSQNAGIVSIARVNLLNVIHDDSRAALELTGTELHVTAKADVLDGNHTLTTTSSPVTANTWLYVSAVIDYANDRIDLYVDGSLILSQATSFPRNVEAGNAENASIGASGSGNGSYFSGLLDEIRIQSTGRSAAWLSAEYASMTGTLVTAGTEQVIPGVLTNDSDVDSDALIVTEIDGPAHAASFILYANGAFDYTPAANYTGHDSFRYAISDGTITSSPILVNLNVTNVNDAPVIATNSIPLTEGGLVQLSIAYLNTTDVDNTASELTYTVSGSQHLTVLVGGVAATSFTQAQVNAGNVSLQHDGTNNTPSMLFTVSDGTATTPVTTANFSYTTVNDAPTISSIANTDINEDQQTGPLAFTIGDEEAAASSLTVQVTSSNPALVPNTASNLVLSGTGSSRSLNIIPTANTSGITTITLSVSDGVNTTLTSFQLRVLAVDDPPTLDINLAATVPEGGTVVISNSLLKSSDIDTPPGGRVYNISTAAVHGRVALLAAPATAISTFTQTQVDAGNVIYVHDGSETSSDAFSFSLSDGTTTLSDTFNINITPANDPPVFANLQFALTEGQTVALTSSNFLATDPDTPATSLTYQVTTLARGRFERYDGVTATATVTTFTQSEINSGWIRFVHDGSNLAPDIQVRISDGTLTTNSQSATVTFTSVNDVPILTDFSNRTVNEDEPTGNIAFTIGDEETATSSLVVSVTSSNTALVDNSNAQLALSGTGANRTLNVIPTLNAVGTTTISVTVSDGVNATTKSFVLTVSPVDDAPGFAQSALSVTEGATVPVSPANLSVTDVDTSDANLQYTVTATHGYFALTSSPFSPVTSFSQADVIAGNIVFVHDGGENAPTVSVTVGDGTTTVGPVTMAIAFTNVDDPPAITNNQIPLYEGGTTTLTAGMLSVEDIDTSASSLVYNVSNLQHVDIQVSGMSSTIFTQDDIDTGRVTVTHDGSNVAGAFSFSVSDGSQSTPLTAAQIIFNPVNDPPTISSITDRVINEDEQTGPVAFVIGDSDTPIGSLTLSVTSSNTALIPADTAHLLLSGSGSNWTVNVIPVANAFGTSTITVTVSDGDQAVTESFVVTVNPVNDVPAITVNNPQHVTEGGAAVIDQTFLSVTDVETPVTGLIYTVTTAPQRGHVAFASAPGNPIGSFSQADINAGRVIYVHDGSETLTDAFSFSVTDGAVATSGTFSLIIDSVNNAPTVVTASLDVTEGGTTILDGSMLLAGDSDTPDSALIFSVQVTGGRFERVSATGVAITTFTQVDVDNGAIQFVDDGNETPPSIDVTVTDGTSTTSPQAVSVVFHAVDDPPAVTANAVTISEGQSVTLSPAQLLASDTDTPAAGLTYSVTNLQHVSVRRSGATVTTFTQADINNGLITLTHDGSNSAPVLEFALADGITLLPVQQLPFSFSAINDAPTLNAIADVTIDEDTSTGPLAFSIGDEESPVGDLVVSVTSSDTNLIPNSAGNLQLTGSGNAWSLNVVPAANMSGTATITVSVNDGIATTSTSFQVTVNAVNDPAILITNSPLTVNEGANAIIGSTLLSATDVDNTAQDIIYTVVTSPLHGRLAFASSPATAISGFTQADIDAGNVIYVHDGSNTSSDSFDVTLNSGRSSTVATFAIQISPINDPPTISAIGSQTISEDSQTGALAFVIGDEESASTALVVTATSSNVSLVPSATGNLVLGGSGANRTINVIPLANAFGTTTITVTVSDGTSSTSTTFDVQVTPVNDVPTLLANNPLTVLEGGSRPIGTALLQTVDVESGAAGMIYTVTTAPVHGILARTSAPAVAITSFTQAEIDANAITYVHDGSQTTADSFGFSVSDGSASFTGTFSIAVSAVNNPPVITVLQLAVTEGQSTLLDNGNWNSSDVDTAAAGRTWSIQSISSGRFERVASPGVAITAFSQADVDNGQIRFVHDGGEQAPSITVTLSDGLSTTALNGVSVTYFAVNDGPTITAFADLLIDEDSTTGPIGFVIEDTETPATALVVSVTSSNPSLVPNSPSSLILAGSGSNRTLEVVPAANRFGTTTITVTVSDGTLSSQSSFLLAVSSVNDAPAMRDQSFTVQENAPDGTVIGSVVAMDIDPSDPLTFTLVDGNADGAFSLSPAGQLKVTDGTRLNFESQPVRQLIVEVRDSAGATVRATVTVQITNVNESPSLASAVFSIPEDAAIGTILGQVSATDPDASETLTYQIISGDPGNIFQIDSASGILRLNRGNVLDSETQPAFNLIIEARDAGGLTSTAAITVNVADVNEPVTASTLATLTGNEDDAPLVTSVASAFHDPDVGDALTYRIVGSLPTLFAGASLNSVTGELVLNLAADQSGTAQIQIEATDSAGHTAIALQEVRIAAVNDAPIGREDVYTVTGGETLDVSTVQGVLSNDTDIDSRLVTAHLVDAPSTGELVFNTDGSFTFTPTPTQSGQTTFTYQVSDGLLTSEVVRVVLNISAPKANGAALLLTTTANTTASSDFPVPTGDSSPSSNTSDSTSSATPNDSPASQSLTSTAAPSAPAAPVVVIIMTTTDDDGTGIAIIPPSILAGDAFTRTTAKPTGTDQDSAGRQGGHASAVLDQILSGFGGTHNGVTIIGTVSLGHTEIAIVPAQQLHLLLQSDSVWQQMDRTEELIESTGRIADLLTNTTTVTFSTSFTIGYVLWTLRGGVLLTTLFAQMPAWRMVDPLVVLENLGSKTSDEEESLEAIVQKGSEMEHIPEEGSDEPA